MEFQAGQPIWWIHQCRGGYGYTERVIAVLVKVGKVRMGIAALKADRVTWVPKWVSIANIRNRIE